jgi:hypothetical protein
MSFGLCRATAWPACNGDKCYKCRADTCVIRQTIVRVEVVGGHEINGGKWRGAPGDNAAHGFAHESAHVIVVRLEIGAHNRQSYLSPPTSIRRVMFKTRTNTVTDANSYSIYAMGTLYRRACTRTSLSCQVKNSCFTPTTWNAKPPTTVSRPA